MKVLSTSALLACLCSPISVAQVNKSNLTGVIRDTSGAAIPEVTVRITHTGTGLVRTESTDASGLYRFTLLDFGVYQLQAERAGFKKSVRSNLQLETGETTTVDVTLDVGDVSESVQVTAESPLLRTETGALGTTVNTQVLNELPLIGRNPYTFLTLSPGIQYTGSPTAMNPWDNAGPSDFTSSGSESRSEFLLDGIPNMRIDLVGFSPSPDAVQEMRVQTNAYDAEYGHSGAAFVNVSTRAGSNRIHGTAYWFHRNDNLNANNFFNNRNGVRKNENKFNTYGFSVGGPVWIPKLYNGRDRTFYFANFEGTQIRGTAFARAIVPTELERAGDFSKTTDLAGRPFTIYDPNTTRPNPSGTGFIRDPFPNNMIPRDRMDSVALKALAYYPLPNMARTAENQENFINPQAGGRRWASAAARADHHLSASHNLFFRYGWNHRTDPSSPFYGEECCRPAGNPTDNQDEFERGNIAGGAGYTWIMSPQTVMDLRMGFTRYFDGNFMYGEGFDLSKLGLPATFTGGVAYNTFPRFEMGGDVQHLGAGRQTNRIYINQYNPLINVHSSYGRHAVKYGLRYQVAQQNSFAPNRSGGFFRFDRTFTQGPDPTRTTLNSGHDLASFLLGTPTRGYVDVNASPALQNTYYSAYVQDDWKTTNRLTLNLGIRFEHEGATTDRFNRGNAGFDFAAANPLAAAAQANYAKNPIPELASLNVRGGLTFLAEGDAPRGHLDMPALLMAPRFGFAYRVTPWMVWRGGYGIFYVPNNVSNYRLDGFSLATQMVTSLDNNLTSFNRLSDPFPNGISQPPGAAGGLLTGVGQSLTSAGVDDGPVPQFKHGLSQQFSMGFQFVLPGSISIETSYVGNVSQRLTITRNINQYPNEFLSLGTRLNARVPNPFFGVITDPTSALSQPTTTVLQLLRPYPQYVGFTQAVLPYGRSNYDSLQMQLTKRMSGGLTFGAAYTFSKMMEATSYLNDNDASPERVISNSDRPHRLVLHGLYELPFGPGRRFGSSDNPVMKHVIGGWQVNWVASFQSNQAIEFANPGADRLYKSDNNPRTVDEWFDVDQFQPREPFTLRALSTRIADLRAPGMHKWDITAMKAFALTEGVQLKFRAEFYNAFNKTHFGTPNTTVTSSNFGRITNTFVGPREIQLALRLVF